MKSKTWLSSLKKKVTKKDGGGGDGGGKSSTKVVPYSDDSQKQVYNLWIDVYVMVDLVWWFFLKNTQKKPGRSLDLQSLLSP